MRRLIALLLLLLAFAGCGVENAGETKKPEKSVLRIMSWNVQTLYDGVRDGNEYEEFAEGWTEEKYRARLNGIASAVGKMDKTPDVFALIEVEKSQILEDLAGGELKKYEYKWTFFGCNKWASLGIGVLSKFPFIDKKVHSSTKKGETIPRPILEVKIEAENKPLVLFVCHWKSKLEGDEETERQRRLAARIIARRVAEIKRETPDMPIAVMGDLNENYDEFSLRGNKYITALIPDTNDAAEFVLANSADKEEKDDFLVVSGEKPPVSAYFSGYPAVFYSPWSDGLPDGSYYYQKAWETIDHFLLNRELFDQKDWEFDICEVVNGEPFVNKSGYPYRYNPKTGDGLSDHLPLLLTLRKER